MMATAEPRRWGAQSAVAPLRRALVRPPSWVDLRAWEGKPEAWGFPAPPNLAAAAAEHAALVATLHEAGVEVHESRHPAPGLYDSVFVGDWAIVTDAGAVILLPGKPVRQQEAELAEQAFAEAGVPVFHRMRGPGTAEGGDLLWLDRHTLLAGHSYRTSREGIDELSRVLRPLGIDVIPTPVLHWKGPGCVMHLLSLISMIDHDLAVAYLPLMAVETVQLLRKRGVELVEVDGQEFLTQGCNVLAVTPGRCIMMSGNSRVRAALEARGVKVLEFAGAELGGNMGGGPTCLVQPLLREY